MKIFITGINGYLGSCMAAAFSAEGHEVHGSQRVSPDLAPCAEVARTVVIRLNGPFDPMVFAGMDSVIHGAHDFSSNGFEANVAGTRRIAEAAKAQGVPRQIFLSSYSARPDTPAAYGRIKYDLENFFLARGEIVVRPGLVIGYGGLFGRNMRKVLTLPVLPLLDGGNDLLPLLSIEDFLEAMGRIVTSGEPGAYNLFNAELVPMRELLSTLKRKAAHRCWFLPVPTSLAVRLLSLFAKLGLKLPVNIDNLRALKLNQTLIYDSHLHELVGRETSLDRMIDVALEQYRHAHGAVRLNA